VYANEAHPWQLDGVEVFTIGSDVNIKADSISYDGVFELNKLQYRCAQQIYLYPLHNCKNAHVSFLYEKQNTALLLETQLDFIRNVWQIKANTLDQQLAFAYSSEADVIQLFANDLQVKPYWRYFSNTLDSVALVLNGVVDIDLNQLIAKANQPIHFSGLNYEYSDEIIVAELAGTVDFEFKNKQLAFDIKIDSGEMLYDQLYVDFSDYPIRLDGSVVMFVDNSFDIQFKITNQQSLSLMSSVHIDKEMGWRFSELSVDVIDSHHFNQLILNNVLGIYGFGNSEMSGGFKISTSSGSDDFDQWKLEFNDFYLLNSKRKIEVEALEGTVFWNKSQISKDSIIRWQSLLFAGMPVNASQLEFNFSADNFNVINVLELPVFDGLIKIDELGISAVFSPAVEMNLKAVVLPISLKLITEKLGWPPMSGYISGNIPGMVKKGNVIKFLGGLNLTVFEGSMRVDNLSLERLFGVAPVIAADVKFEDFNLAMLTDTFGFGQITGRLFGEVNKLRITNWKTDRLDAEVYTVKTKGVKQTISQKAIDNISSLGGIKGAISKTFLRFFDDFRYKKIKLSCKLHNAVCQIGGLKNQNNQFVIVEGGGIPKINIVGYVRSINWEEFIDRLLNANYGN